jgi:hypothetical protein
MAHELHRQPFLIGQHRRQSARELPYITGKYDFWSMSGVHPL